MKIISFSNIPLVEEGLKHTLNAVGGSARIFYVE